MSRKYVDTPVDPKYREFCEFMGYAFLSNTSNGFLVYSIPQNHLCRFLINYAKWVSGSFDKEAFNKLTDI